ncbi:hypothetical protein NQ015_08120 [Corynebacterium sp. 153RC1]|uniref:hypothetical protein n=1 Tax=unclassified Corynebacterium TaxID=2624378 RepID=UPI00211C196C|nr:MULTISPECIES: hypothetical protein [unclassified Corynebacterium]MCQ9352990.1 hypothetical protein [Corynebacterium sp. 209RC1]MCQ9355172.1 hypothetical protein [Corynebacterium sp. 1222RC1]MCQ9357297.1 hypothetical protein [Corynebacterium sp. 122RC1]MCQ9359473.1 hypothetical protein [Corynebacterium sp. 142RC1]MCQ9361727.1 hypothetical protein [Corynebacterium sp. 153RC1]
MNPQHRNALIAGINRTMEGLSQIAQALESDGWEGVEDEYALAGPRPVAAARLEEPAFQAELEERLAAEAQHGSESATAVREYTLEEVRSFLAELSQQGYTAQVRQLILDAGAKALSEVDPAKFGQIMAGAEEIAHA